MKVTVAEPVAPQSSLKALKSCDQVTAEQLSEAVIRLFKSPEMLQDFGVAGRSRVLSEFNPEERVKKIAVLYEEVMGNKSKCRQII